MPPKSNKEVSKQPDKEAQLEQKLILKDVRDKAFRAAVVPCAYSVEEFVLGLVRFEEIRLKSIKLTEDEVSSSSSSVSNGKAALRSRARIDAYGGASLCRSLPVSQCC